MNFPINEEEISITPWTGVVEKHWTMIFDRVLFAHLLMDRFVCNTISDVVQRNKDKLQERTVL